MTDIERYLRAATRDNTRRSYQAAIAHFETHWGGFLPATAESIARVEGTAVFPRPPLLYRRGCYSVWSPQYADFVA